MKRLTIVIIAFIFGMTSCSEWVKDLPTEPGSFGPRSQNSIDDHTSDPVPGRPGPYEVCTREYNLSDPAITGKIYVPVSSQRTCTVLRNFPLVLISHADGAGIDHLDYEELAQHLASNAFVVVSFDRDGVGADQAFDRLLENHLDYLYTASDIRDVITNQIGFIGHSAGGRAVIRHAGVINDYGKELKSLVVMAPTIDLSTDYSFTNQASSFLSLHVASDTDANAFGRKMPGQVMESTFKVYDDARLIVNQPNNLSVTKDMIFAKGGLHYFQKDPFALTYINAFLQVHLNGHEIFNRFLKFQEKPPTLATNVYQQHADPVRLVVANFENGSLKKKYFGRGY